MFSLLLITHIIALSASIIATTTMFILALLSHASPQFARRANLLVTGIGIVIGAVLLIQNPLGPRCLELTSYLIIFSFAYRYITIQSSRLIDNQTPNASNLL